MAECPNKEKSQSAHAADEAAEVAFVTVEDEAHHACVQEPPGTCFLGADSIKGSLVDQCYGIIDSGATASLGSVEALEAVMERNIAELGTSKVEVDLEKKPTFKFGNGQRKTCLSTARLGMMAGKRPGLMEIHVHNSPGQPILVSRKALRSLGAVIDFSNNECVLKNVDPKKVIVLKEAENGHMLLPVTGNLLSEAKDRNTSFEGLLDE